MTCPAAAEPDRKNHRKVGSKWLRDQRRSCERPD